MATGCHRHRSASPGPAHRSLAYRRAPLDWGLRQIQRSVPVLVARSATRKLSPHPMCGHRLIDPLRTPTLATAPRVSASLWNG